MEAMIPADLEQYYEYTLRAVQKLLYLCGFPEIDSYKNDLSLNNETINTLSLCLGIMYGAAGVEKQLQKKVLTMEMICSFVRSVVKWFDVNMTKRIFAGLFKDTIPVL